MDNYDNIGDHIYRNKSNMADFKRRKGKISNNQCMDHCEDRSGNCTDPENDVKIFKRDCSDTYSCQKCNNKFLTKSDLTFHDFIHSGEQFFQCGV